MPGVTSCRVLPYPESRFWANVCFQEGIVMLAAVKIKVGEYGRAIGLLLKRGGAFQTRHERTLIVDAAQKEALEEAGLIETLGLKQRPTKKHGKKKDAG
jgi:hypothetical protein